MTVLTVFQEVSAECGLEIPVAVLNSAVRTHVELGTVLNEAALHIARYHEWQALNSEVGFAGNGSATSFPFPSNFDRVRDSEKPWNTTTNMPLVRVREPSKWHELERRGFDGVFQHSIILNNRFNVSPALADGDVVQLYYQSANIFEDAGGNFKRAATADSDVFRLNERALKLVTEAFWKAKNGQASAAEVLQKATALLDDLVATDKGNREKSIVKAA